MMKLSDQKRAFAVLVAMVAIYVLAAGALIALVNSQVIQRAPAEAQEYVPALSDTSPPPPDVNKQELLRAAIAYVEKHLTEPNGHIDTYQPLHEDQQIQGSDDTNSEAISYSMQIAAQQSNKYRFDRQLEYMQQHMLHPEGEYMMWRLNGDDQAIGEGRNVAPDADLRALKALYIAKDRWGDKKYDQAIDELASSLEEVAITDDNRLAAYAGMSGEQPWRAEESYLSYSDFQVLERLADTRRGRWEQVSENMREITLGAQIENGLYNSEYWPGGSYGNSVDGGVYSINSMWIMVRLAESNEDRLMQSANESLQFYRNKYIEDGKIYSAYDSSGSPVSDYESVWAYALIARAAAALGDEPFEEVMLMRMINFQETERNEELYGAFVEGAQGDERVGQFTMQESILTLQESLGLAPRFY